MADRYAINKTTLDGIADQAQELNGTTAAMSPAAIEQSIAEANAEINAQADQIDELREILANKAAASPVVEKLTVTENGIYTPPSGTDGYAPVNVNVPAPEPVIVPLNVTENGTYEAPDGTDGYSPVTVNVQPKLQEKSVAPSTQAQEVTPDSGYDGMIKVNVSAVKTAEQATPTITFDDVTGLITAKTEQAEGYVNEGTKQATKQLDVRNADNMVVSGATVTAPAGYYPNDVSKSVKTAERNAPTIKVDANGLITAETIQDEGYTVGGEKSATKQLPTTAGKTITPSNAEQTAVSAGTFVIDEIKVAKIPSEYIKPNGTKSITKNGTHDVTSFASVDVNVPSSGGGYLTCTIELTNSGVNGAEMTYCKLINGIATYITEDINGSMTLSDVVCCSAMYFYGDDIVDFVISDNMTSLLDSYPEIVVAAPLIGNNGTIYMTD